MDGILIIDKPAGITSHDVVNRVRRVLKTKRVGHTGTLDPFATGVMVVMVGQATRLARFIDKDEKEYEALITFGFETDTGDRTSEQRSPAMPADEVVEKLAEIDWEDVFTAFRGEIDQTPPMYSAKKIDGKKLYELARQGETVERKPVRVFIARLGLSDAQPPSDSGQIAINVACSAGTYIRTLAEDIGRRIGIGAHLAELRRTRSGRSVIDQSIRLDKLMAADDPTGFLLSIDRAVEHLPVFVLHEPRVEKTRQGLATRSDQPEADDGQPYRMNDENGRLIAIGYYDKVEKIIQPRIVLG